MVLFNWPKKKPAKRAKGSAVKNKVSDMKINKTPFRKQLAWWVKNPPSTTIRVNATPEVASLILEWNTNNRPLSPVTIATYARQMREGKWLYTREPIIFSDTRIIDGQHRLSACIKSGASFDVDLAFGAPDEAFSYIDTGKARTSGDVFAMNGVPNYLHLAAAARLLWRHEKNGMASIGAINAPSNEDLYQFYLQHKGLDESVRFGRKFVDQKLASPSVMTAMHYICARKNRAHADMFFEQAATGIGLMSDKDPAYRLRQKLIENTIGHARLSSEAIAAYTIKAWNAMRKNRPLAQFKWRGEQRPNEAFPKEV